MHAATVFTWYHLTTEQRRILSAVLESGETTAMEVGDADKSLSTCMSSAETSAALTSPRMIDSSLYLIPVAQAQYVTDLVQRHLVALQR